MLILGIHIDPPFVRAALVIKTRKGMEVSGLKAAPLSIPEDVKQLYMLPENFQQKNRLSKRNSLPFKGRIISGLSAKEVLVRSIELKIPGKKHVEEAVAFQSDTTTYLNPNSTITVFLLKKRENGFTKATLFTAPKEALENHLIQFKQLEIDPDQISPIPSALCHFVSWKYPTYPNAVIVDLGSSESTCVLMENGELKKSHSITEGIESLLSALWQDRKKILLQKEIEGAAKQIDLLLLKPNLNPHLTAQIKHLRSELLKTIHSFEREGGKCPIIMTGRTDAFLHLQEFLLEESIPLESTEERKFASAIGLAFESDLQFRRSEFFPSKTWKKLGKYALTLLVSSFLLSGAFMAAGIHSSGIRKQKMAEALSYIKRKGFTAEMTCDEKINRWISAVEKNNKEYPFISRAPKVAEALSWLSTHPLLLSLKESGDPIDLHEIRYQLVNFPKIGSAKEPYLSKVELEFEFKSDLHARKFHEALLAGDETVDPNLEITWETTNSGYRTSFFLKNRGPYVP